MLENNGTVPGLFIVIEGPDGCGKGTQAKMLVDYLRQKGMGVVHTREPGGTQVAESLRAVLLSKDYDLPPSSVAEVLIFSAARADHVDKIINPNLELGRVVVSERFYPATIAYQHHGRGVDYDLIKSATKLAIGDTEPDLVLILDVSPEVGLRRKADAAAKEGAPILDRFEEEKIGFHKRVRNGYAKMAHLYPRQYTMLDASGPIEQVFESVKKEVDRLLETRQLQATGTD